MRLSEKQLHEFQELYRLRFGEELSDEVAREKAARLLRMMEIVLRHKAQDTGK